MPELLGTIITFRILSIYNNILRYKLTYFCIPESFKSYDADIYSFRIIHIIGVSVICIEIIAVICIERSDRR